MKDFLLNILRDPVDGNPLHLADDKQSLKNETGTTYQIKDDVPVLLPGENLTKTSNSSLHRHFNSGFSYADHYQKDTEVYDYFAGDESNTTKNERKRSREAIINRVKNEHALLLDIGCGGGWVAQYFLPKGKQVISMDISVSNPVKVLKENPGVNHAALTADTFHLPLQKESVDCIIASEIIEHVFDPALFILKLLAVLKPGGRIIIVTPYDEKLKYHLCVHCNKPTPENAHLHSFNEKNIANYLPGTGINFTTHTFSNKYLTRLRIYNLLSFLPFSVWKLIDSMANAIFKKPTVFLVEINKTTN